MKNQSDDVIWEKAATYLRDSDSDLDALSDLSLSCDNQTHKNSIVARVLDALAPTDNAEMLGRIGGYDKPAVRRWTIAATCSAWAA